MNSISPIELRDKINASDEILLVDVREAYERQEFHIGGEWIPMNTIFDQINKIPQDKPVVLYCQKGIRSGLAIQRLQQRFGYENLVNLTGGMEAWRKQFGKDV
jgi:adenylyltransferase/sulfurtransferase